MLDWKQKRLADLAEIRTSNVDKKSYPHQFHVRLCNYMDVYSHDYITGDIRFMTATATAAEVQRFGVEEGDVLLTKDSEKPDDIGIPTVVTEQIDNLVCGYHLALLKPNKDCVDPVYLAKQLATTETVSYFARYANGSTRYGLSSGSLAATPIQVAPLKQQQRIAEILSTVDEAIEQTEALIAKTQQIKTGLMHDLFTRGVTPDGQLRPPREQAPELYKESPLGWIPKDWTATRLGQLLHDRGGFLQTGPFGSQLHAHEYRVDGVPVVMPQNISNGAVDSNQISRIATRRAQELARHRMRPGDIVIARRGELSRAASIGDWERGWLCGTGCFLLRLGQSLLDPNFIAHAYRQDFVQRQVDANAVGTTMPSLNNSVMTRLWFPFCDENEQNRLASRIEGIEQSIAALIKTSTSYKRVKKGLMQDLLTGRVRVPVEDAAPPKKAAASVSG